MNYLLATLALLCPLIAPAGVLAASVNVKDFVPLQVTTAIPLFSQMLLFSYPKGFTLIHSERRSEIFFQQYVLDGESKNDWSQAVRITALKNMAADLTITPERVAASIAKGYLSDCPNSHTFTPFSGLKSGRHNVFAIVMSCGTIAPKQSAPYSRSELTIVIQGDKDYYTVQWIERSLPSEGPIPFNQDKWSDRFKFLIPIKLCPVIPGEKPPYPSCT
ncbi:MAG: hypothetical protein ACRCU9_10940 [Iodobacter sp.]